MKIIYRLKLKDSDKEGLSILKKAIEENRDFQYLMDLNLDLGLDLPKEDLLDLIEDYKSNNLLMEEDNDNYIVYAWDPYMEKYCYFGKGQRTFYKSEARVFNSKSKVEKFLEKLKKGDIHYDWKYEKI